MLVADIGGTNARFGLVGADGKPQRLASLACADYPDVASAVEAYLSQQADRRPRYACFAVACPVKGDEVRFTNSPWQFSIATTAGQLGLEKLEVINDFTALAMALPGLSAAEKRQIGGGQAVERATIAVLGPGTGLGVSGLLWSPVGWIPLAGEGGHVGFAPFDDREAEILRLLRRRYGRVSLERLLSGEGLRVLYLALSELAGAVPEALESADIVSRGIDGSSPLCCETLDRFSAILGGAAGDLALTLGARGGLYLGGGILPRFAETFAAGPFRERFEAKGRFSDYVRAIPTWLIEAEMPALRGAAAWLRHGQET